MRSEKQIYEMILNFAKSDERIRMVTLEGSRTNVNIPADDFQDYDITYFVTDIQSFTTDDSWLNVFGERLIMQKPEDMELFPAEEKGFSYLMLFYDDVKIDLTLLSLDLIDEYFTWDKLVKLLLDKDNRIYQPPVPTDIDYHLQCPTARMFDDCCNEFWNTIPYVVFLYFLIHCILRLSKFEISLDKVHFYQRIFNFNIQFYHHSSAFPFSHAVPG